MPARLARQIQALIAVGNQQIVPDVRRRHRRGQIQDAEDFLALPSGGIYLEQLGICPEIAGIQAGDGLELGRGQQ